MRANDEIACYGGRVHRLCADTSTVAEEPSAVVITRTAAYAELECWNRFQLSNIFRACGHLEAGAIRGSLTFEPDA